MFASVLRVLLGFIAACLAAGLTTVLFVYTPAELAMERAGDRVSEALLLSLVAATQTAVFAAPLALIGAGIGEWRGFGGRLYYMFVALLIAGVGFFALSWGEGGVRGAVNTYAIAAFAVTGLVAGLVYWLCSGRFAGRRRGTPEVPADAKEAAA